MSAHIGHASHAIGCDVGALLRLCDEDDGLIDEDLGEVAAELGAEIEAGLGLRETCAHATSLHCSSSSLLSTDDGVGVDWGTVSRLC